MRKPQQDLKIIFKNGGDFFVHINCREQLIYAMNYKN